MAVLNSNVVSFCCKERSGTEIESSFQIKWFFSIKVGTIGKIICESKWMNLKCALGITELIDFEMLKICCGVVVKLIRDKGLNTATLAFPVNISWNANDNQTQQNAIIVYIGEEVIKKCSLEFPDASEECIDSLRIIMVPLTLWSWLSIKPRNELYVRPTQDGLL